MRFTDKKCLATMTVGLAIIAAGLGFLVNLRLERYTQGLEGLVVELEPVSLRETGTRQVQEDEDGFTVLVEVNSSIIVLVKRLSTQAETRDLFFDYASRSSFTFDGKALAAFHQAVDDADGVARALDELSQCTEFSVSFYVINGKTARRDFQSLRFLPLAQLIDVSARVAIAEGDLGEGLENALMLFRMARFMDAGLVPSSIRYSSSNLCRSVACQLVNDVLSAGLAWPNEQQEQIVSELEKCADFDAHRRSISADRAWTIELINTMPIHRIALNGPPCLEYFKGKLTRWDAGVFPKAETKKAASFLNGDELPALIESWQALDLEEARIICRVRGLRIALALLAMPEIRTQEVDGEELLASLGIPANLLLDPITGDELRVLKDNGTWRIYSVGVDGVDNHGDAQSDMSVVTF